MVGASSDGDCLHATTTGKVYRYQEQTLPTEQQQPTYCGTVCELFRNIAGPKGMSIFHSIFLLKQYVTLILLYSLLFED